MKDADHTRVVSVRVLYGAISVRVLSGVVFVRGPISLLRDEEGLNSCNSLEHGASLSRKSVLRKSSTARVDYIKDYKVHSVGWYDIQYLQTTVHSSTQPHFHSSKSSAHIICLSTQHLHHAFLNIGSIIRLWRSARCCHPRGPVGSFKLSRCQCRCYRRTSQRDGFFDHRCYQMDHFPGPAPQGPCSIGPHHQTSHVLFLVRSDGSWNRT